MKVQKSVAIAVTLATVAVLTGSILRGSPPATTQAADQEFTIPGVPTDRQPERYTGSFLDTTVTAMLRRLNVQVNSQDKVYAFPDPALGLGSTVLVYRAQAVQLTDAKTTRLVFTWAPTVQALADEQNLDLADQDVVVPARDASIPIQADPVTVKVTRVAIAQLVLTSSVPFSTQYKDDPNMDKGKQVTDQAGKNGTLQKTYQVRREDGIEVSRVLQKSEQTVAPVTEIIRRGTRPVITVRCAYNDTVLAAAQKNNIDPNALCYRMMAESNGHANSSGSGGKYEGLFQYDPSFWASVSAKAGYPGASIWDATAQINVTAWAWAHGYRGRWPNP